MPQIMRVSCDACAFAKEEHIPLTLVVADDGTEHVCPHPGERRTAERITGRTWKELRRSGRVQHHYALICLACGEVDHYATRRPRNPSQLGFIRSITFVPKAGDAAGIPCTACGAVALASLTGSFTGVACPSCGKPALTSTVTAIA